MDVIPCKSISLITILLTATSCAIQEAGDHDVPEMSMTNAQAASLKAVVAAMKQALALPRRQTTTDSIARLFGEEEQSLLELADRNAAGQIRQ